MSYQLPDLLTCLTSLSTDDYDGDLHINPSYAPDDNSNSNFVSRKNEILHQLLLLDRPPPTAPKSSNKEKLRKTPKELVEEYNPGLLASLYLPFSAILNARDVGEEEGVEGVVKEWLSVCAVVVEETVRPGRIIGVPVGEMKECLETTAKRLTKFSYSPPQIIDEIVLKIVTASQHPPPKPLIQHNQITEYLNWRVDLSGHRVLIGLIIPPHLWQKYARAVELILEIVVCVVDLFAYNIHQAWPPSNHLNLISYLLLCNGGDSGMTLQSAINATGEMIRQRITELKIDLGNEENKTNSNGFLANFFSPFFSSSNNNQDTANTHNNEDLDIRKTLWNWISGTIHWAYEVEYFAPDLENDGKKKKKRGGEVRDYGWVFLIPNQC